MTEQEWLTGTPPPAMLAWASGAALGPTTPSALPPGYRAMTARQCRLFACGCCRLVWGSLDEESRRAVACGEAWADGADPDSRDELAGRTSTGCLYHDADVGARLAMDYASGRGCTAGEVASVLRDIFGNPWRPASLPPVCVRCGGERYEPETDHAVCAGCGGAMTGRKHCTPDVLSLARAAYEERERRECRACIARLRQAASLAAGTSPSFTVGRIERLAEEMRSCPLCHGTGCEEAAAPDSHRLAVLADALEEAGCQEQALLLHLRGVSLEPFDGGVKGAVIEVPLPGPHVRGCWAVDLVRGVR